MFALIHKAIIFLFKYYHVIRLGANKVCGFRWRDNDIQFRLSLLIKNNMLGRVAGPFSTPPLDDLKLQ